MSIHNIIYIARQFPEQAQEFAQTIKKIAEITLPHSKKIIYGKDACGFYAESVINSTSRIYAELELVIKDPLLFGEDRVRNEYFSNCSIRTLALLEEISEKY